MIGKKKVYICLPQLPSSYARRTIQSRDREIVDAGLKDSKEEKERPNQLHARNAPHSRNLARHREMTIC